MALPTTVAAALIAWQDALRAFEDADLARGSAKVALRRAGKDLAAAVVPVDAQPGESFCLVVDSQLVQISIDIAGQPSDAAPRRRAAAAAEAAPLRAVVGA